MVQRDKMRHINISSNSQVQCWEMMQWFLRTYDDTRDLYCEPCDTSFTSHAHAQQHLSGRNHKRVVSGLAPLKAGYFNTRTGKWQRQPPQDGDETNSKKVLEADQVFNHHPVPPGLPPPPPPPPPLPGTEGGESGKAPFASKFFGFIFHIQKSLVYIRYNLIF